jgi:hypothetical protein
MPTDAHMDHAPQINAKSELHPCQWTPGEPASGTPVVTGCEDGVPVAVEDDEEGG